MKPIIAIVFVLFTLNSQPTSLFPPRLTFPIDDLQISGGGGSLGDPRENLSQEALLARFADNTMQAMTAEASQAEVQRTVSAEAADRQSLEGTARSVSANIIFPPFNWLKCFTKRGLTWRRKSHNCANGLDLVGCLGCNPYSGDTQCYQYRPILCIYRAQDVRPDYVCGNPFYEGWSGGHIKITRPVRGCYIYSKAHADAICRANFGSGWGIASHHDGKYIWGMTGNNFAYSSWNWGAASTGGWNFYAYGNISTTPYNSYWTFISDQPGNCWN